LKKISLILICIIRTLIIEDKLISQSFVHSVLCVFVRWMLILFFCVDFKIVTDGRLAADCHVAKTTLATVTQYSNNT
jgi:hypothetical protein